MERDRDIVPALTAMAAIAGSSFGSGQEIILFFSQLGDAAWPGMLLAALLMALMTGMILRICQHTGADNFPDLFRRTAGQKYGDVIGLLYGLLMACTAAMMLKTCGELGALTLPVRNGYWQGMTLALMLAITIALSPLKWLALLGAVALLSTILFYTALFLDVRPVHTPIRIETVLRLKNNYWAMGIFALLHACLNISIAAPSLTCASRLRPHPGRCACLTGGMMLICLFCGHAALLRGGQSLFGQSLPMVILAARWGISGFWISAGFMYLCALSTLSACIRALTGQFLKCQSRPRALCLLPGTLLTWALFIAADEALGLAYPCLGWICAFALGVLACMIDKRQWVKR